MWPMLSELYHVSDTVLTKHGTIVTLKGHSKFGGGAVWLLQANGVLEGDPHLLQ